MKKIAFFLFASIALFIWQLNAQITSFPYTEDFESGSMPTGWVKELPGSGNDVIVSDLRNHTSGGQYSVRFSSYHQSSDYNQYLFTDTIHVTSNYMEVSFWVKEYSTSESLQWGIAVGAQSSSSVSSWNDIQLSTSWQKITVQLTGYQGQTIFFAWHYYADYQYYVFLDDVKIDMLSDCPEPYDLSVNPVSANEVYLDWTSPVSQWEVEYDTTGFVQGTGTIFQVNSKPYLLSGLTPQQTYDYYVRSNCGNGIYSNWVGPYTWHQPYVNDYCSGAIDLPVNQGCSPTVVNDANAVHSGVGYPSCSDYYGGDLWYKITVPEDLDTLIVKTGYYPGNHSIYDTGMVIYTGDCDNLTPAYCNGDGNDPGDGMFSRIVLTNVHNGDEYYVRVFSESEDYGVFHLCAYAPNLRTKTLNTTDFSFHPNPSSNVIYWKANEDVEKVQITNLTGQVVIDVSNPKTNSLNIAKLNQGVYFLHVIVDGKEGTYKLIKE